jgi:hypothetical protein
MRGWQSHRRDLKRNGGAVVACEAGGARPWHCHVVLSTARVRGGQRARERVWRRREGSVAFRPSLGRCGGTPVGVRLPLGTRGLRVVGHWPWPFEPAWTDLGPVWLHFVKV